MKLQTLTLTGWFIASALAHGGIYTYEIDGKKYDGNPITTPRAENVVRNSIQRRWWYKPNYDVLSTNVSCSWDGGPEYEVLNASLHAPIQAGQTITAYYDTVDFDPNYERTTEYSIGNWPHTDGPISTYMARCPGDSCVGWDPTGKNVWFKINEYGLEDGLTADNFTLRRYVDEKTGYVNEYYDYVWQQYRRLFGQRKLYGWQGGKQTGVPATIPVSLTPGKYLLRTEVVFFYRASPEYNEPGGYQLYHNCAQLDVTGGGSKLPTDGLVAFPGAYQPDDKGFVFYETFPKPYVFPGPKVWTGQ